MDTGRSALISRPIQLFGLYLAWCESVIAAGLFATDHSSWAQILLICAMAFGIVAFALVVGFLLIYLAVRRPGFLFNPSDFDPSVQHMLFGPGVPALKITQVPPAEQGAQEPDAAA